MCSLLFGALSIFSTFFSIHVLVYEYLAILLLFFANSSTFSIVLHDREPFGLSEDSRSLRTKRIYSSHDNIYNIGNPAGHGVFQ